MLTEPLAPSRLAPLEAAAGQEKTTQHRPLKKRRERPAEPPMLSPTQLADDSRFLRGNLTHALLEHLPQVPQLAWARAADAFLARHGTRLSAANRIDIARETLAILEHPVLGALFGPNSRAEVPIVAELPPPDGKGPALRLTGKIDRLVVKGESILILDYKTNRPSPVDEQSVPEAYLYQLAAYRLGIAQIFPGKTVEAAILWTDGLRYMLLAQDRLDAYAGRLWQAKPR
jgi:ATP-dependent helicase/nuclease subunit A